MEIYKKIEEFRKRLKYSQESFGNKLNIPQSKVSKIENGKEFYFDNEFLSGLIKEFNVNLNSLFDDSYSKIEYLTEAKSNIYHENDLTNLVNENSENLYSTIRRLNLEIKKLNHKIDIKEKTIEMLVSQGQNKQAR